MLSKVLPPLPFALNLLTDKALRFCSKAKEVAANTNLQL